ncbi:aryl-alcohol oxidase precursor [Mycena vulgaris]|nr:aryl-alcohol oxidase precursor [Mycena vulgaris]
MLTKSLLSLAWVTTCLAKVYERVPDLPGLNYDFVIIGGGTSGNVVANRLTENPNFSVLVLEAGVSNERVIDSIVPFLVGELLQANIYEWNYTTIPQTGLNGRTVGYPRAHILGGCSAHNGMIYTRGSADDFNRYAALTDDPGWSWDRMLPYFLKNEKWTQPADHHNTRGQFDPSVHTTRGMNSVSLNGYPWPIFEHHVIETTRKLPEEFPFNLDMNSGKPLGVGWLQSTVGDGKRSTSATSYLAPKFIQRENLHVLLNAQVSKLVNSHHTNGKVVFGGVQFLQGGSLFTAKATKEIILSAGSVGTPAILLHSGIGDREALAALGIPSLLDLKSVGMNATDQPLFGVAWSVNSTQTIDSITQNITRYNEAFTQWNRTHTGPFVELGATHIAWLRLKDDSPILTNVTDPSAGPGTPHIEMAMGPSGPPASVATGNFMNMGLVVLTPTSRGSVMINSSDPVDPPVIDLGILTSEFDIFTAREAIKRAYRFIQAPIWKDYIIGPTVDLANFSPEALDEYIRNSAGPSAHLVGTAAMSAKGARYGVVDPDLLVKGASGLRIIDASILPLVPSAHTQAAAYVVGERGADLVKESWK